MIEIRHRLCGGVAFRYDHLPTPGEVIDSNHVMTLDGSIAIPHDLIVCGSCGEVVALRDLAVPAERNWSN